MKNAWNQHRKTVKALIRRVLASIFALAILNSSVLFSFAEGLSLSTETADKDVSYDPEKVYSTATIDQDFAPDSVLVVIKKGHGGINKVFSTERFSTSTLKAATVFSEVKDLTYLEKPVEEYKYLSLENRKQIFKLTLAKPGKQNVLDTIKELEKLDFIESAGPNYYLTTFLSPNDDLFHNQDYIGDIGLKDAWNITTGSSSVRVGVIDTGIALQDDLNSTSSTVEYNIAPGYDYFHNNNITTDDQLAIDDRGFYLRHGTAVASILGAVTNNSNGIAGVCWKVKMVPMQVTDFNETTEKNTINLDAVVAAVTAASLDIPIINCSFGFQGALNNDMLNVFAAYTGLAVCAAGNTRDNTDYISVYPACLPLDNIISVGALDRTLTEVGDWSEDDASNHGQTTVDLFAPGTRIQALTVERPYYTIVNGTSFAAPFVTGVAALIKSVRPSATATEIKAYILQNVDFLPGFDKQCLTGGKLNAYKAVKAAQEGRLETEPLMGDVNGDGKEDIIYHYPSNGKRAFKVYLAQTNGTFSGPYTTVTTHSYRYTDPAFVGDVNGDGKDDVIIHWTNSDGKRVLLTLISNGNGSFPSTGVNFVSTNSHDPIRWPAKLLVADVNGDGKSDFVVQWKNASDDRATYTYLGKASSSGGYFSAAVVTASTVDYKLQDHVFTGDFNGDGRADLLVQTASGANKRQLITYIGKSDGSFATPVTFTSAEEYYPFRVPGRWAVPSQFFVGDVNGDGYDDFVVSERVPTAGNRKHLVYRGKASSTYFNEAVETQATNSYQIAYKTYSGDFNGDGRMDLMEHRRSNGKRLLVFYSGTSTGGFATSVSYLGTRNHDPSSYGYKVTIGSLSGKSTFLVHWVSGNSNTNSINIINYYINSSDSTTMTEGVDTTTSAPFSGS